MFNSDNLLPKKKRKRKRPKHLGDPVTNLGGRASVDPDGDTFGFLALMGEEKKVSGSVPQDHISSAQRWYSGLDEKASGSVPQGHISSPLRWYSGLGAPPLAPIRRSTDDSGSQDLDRPEHPGQAPVGLLDLRDNNVCRAISTKIMEHRPLNLKKLEWLLRASLTDSVCDLINMGSARGAQGIVRRVLLLSLSYYNDIIKLHPSRHPVPATPIVVDGIILPTIFNPRKVVADRIPDYHVVARSPPGGVTTCVNLRSLILECQDGMRDTLVEGLSKYRAKAQATARWLNELLPFNFQVKPFSSMMDKVVYRQLDLHDPVRCRTCNFRSARSQLAMKGGVEMPTTETGSSALKTSFFFRLDLETITGGSPRVMTGMWVELQSESSPNCIPHPQYELMRLTPGDRYRSLLERYPHYETCDVATQDPPYMSKNSDGNVQEYDESLSVWTPLEVTDTPPSQPLGFADPNQTLMGIAEALHDFPQEWGLGVG